MLRLAFDFIITWRETRTRPNAYSSTTSLYQPKNLTPIHFVRLVKDGKSTGISLYITSVN